MRLGGDDVVLAAVHEREIDRHGDGLALGLDLDLRRQLAIAVGARDDAVVAHVDLDRRIGLDRLGAARAIERDDEATRRLGHDDEQFGNALLELGLKLGQDQERQFGEIVGPIFGDNQFDNIVRFMSGRSPGECPLGEVDKPGSEKCIALVYEGVEAVRKIRDVLGPTDPSKAPPGSIRREFGQTIMVNAAHASDSEENSKREIGIVNVAENNFKQIIEQFYGKL